jgi:hypothetical protein
VREGENGLRALLRWAAIFNAETLTPGFPNKLSDRKYSASLGLNQTQVENMRHNP